MNHDEATWLASWDQSAPRYTSYPTVPAWKKEVLPSFEAEALARVREPVQVYVHVPFCVEQCAFCGCNMVVARQRRAGRRYLDALRVRVARLPLTADRIRAQQLHLGGGTPTWFTPEELAELVEIVSTRFSWEEGHERSIEVNPAVTSDAHLDELDELGFNRLSMGVQSFDDRVLAAVGRKPDGGRVGDMVHRVRDLGWSGVSLDLMYGLPEQTLDTFGASLDHVLALRPDRLSVFGYAHVPWAKRHQQALNEDAMPTVQQRASMWLAARNRMVEAGYIAVGFDHYALPDDELAQAATAGRLHRNFMGYATTDVDLIGLGCSAISQVNGSFWQIEPKLGAWLKAVDQDAPLVRRVLTLSNEDRRRSEIIRQIMCQLRAPVDPELDQAAIEALRSPEWAGLVEVTDEVVKVKEVARPLTRLVAMQFDTYLSPPGPGRGSRLI